MQAVLASSKCALFIEFLALGTPRVRGKVIHRDEKGVLIKAIEFQCIFAFTYAKVLLYKLTMILIGKFSGFLEYS